MLFSLDHCLLCPHVKAWDSPEHTRVHTITLKTWKLWKRERWNVNPRKIIYLHFLFLLLLEHKREQQVLTWPALHIWVFYTHTHTKLSGAIQNPFEWLFCWLVFSVTLVLLCWAYQQYYPVDDLHMSSLFELSVTFHFWPLPFILNMLYLYLFSILFV